MKKLRYAIAAFISILRSKDHVFVDDEIISFMGDRNKIAKYEEDITNGWNDLVNQHNILNEAKEILSHEKT